MSDKIKIIENILNIGKDIKETISFKFESMDVFEKAQSMENYSDTLYLIEEYHEKFLNSVFPEELVSIEESLKKILNQLKDGEV